MKTRTEKEMLELIQNFIESDERIRVAILNGSRANPKIKKDMFQDYDIACFVTDVEPFFVEADIVPYFGETIIVEQPNFGPWPPDDADGSYHNYNMQFMDGNRIDLTFFSMNRLEQHSKDSLSVILIDKDELCPDLAPANDRSYYIEKPSKEQYKGCCDAFFFALGSHIPKNIWRKHLPLLKSYTEGWLRVPVRLMLSWEIGEKTGFNKSIGAGGKYLEIYLEPEKWEMYLSTYVDSDYESIWESLFIFYEMFTDSAIYIAEKYGYQFPQDTAVKVQAFLKHVRQLSSKANTIY